MSWHNYTVPIKTLEYNDFNNINENLNYLRDALLIYDYDINELESFTASYSTQLIDVRTILNDIEQNIDTLNNTDCESIYYGDSVSYTNIAANTTQVNRWILILNDLYDIIINNKGKWSNMILSNGDIATDTNGKYFVIRGEQFE